MEKDSTGSGGAIDITGLNLQAGEEEPAGATTPTRVTNPENTKKPAQDINGTAAGQDILEAGVEFPEALFLDMVSLPFRLLSVIRGKEYWELNKKEEAILKRASKCMIRVVPAWLVKGSCLGTFILALVTIVMTRITREKKDNPVIEEDVEIKDKESTGKKIMRGTRNG